MKQKLIITILLALIFTSCTAKAAEAPATEAVQISTTPDLCARENITAEITKTNKLMRAFDDYSSLASSTPTDQLVSIIPAMQSIRRDTQDLQVPTCLDSLKKIQLAHMNTVIQVLLAFMSQSNNTEALNAGIQQARELHTQYDLEIARLLGITPQPAPTP